MPLEDVPTQSDMLLSTPKSLKQQKDYFRAFISHKNVHRSLNRREELLPYLNSKIAVYRQYPLGYIPTHHHQVLNVGSNAVESDTSPAAIHYGKAIKHKSALDPISLQSLADMHKPTKNKTISKVTQTILEKKTKHVHSAMKSVAHEAKNKANLNAEHDNGTAHAPIQKQITSLTPFELPEGIEEANPKQALRSLAPPKPLLRSTSKTTQFVRPGVPERAEQSKPMPKKTVEKPSVQVPARPKYKESSIDDEVPTTPPVRRKKSLKQSMLLVPEERGISDSNEIVDTAESVTRIVKLKKKRASKKSLVSSTSIENVENVSSTCLVSKEKRKSDPKVSNDIQKTSSETILKQKNIQQILVSKTVDKKSGAPTTRPAGESNSVRAPLPKIKPPPKVLLMFFRYPVFSFLTFYKAAALMKKAKEESAIINDILQAEPSNEGFLASLLKKMNLVDEDSKNRINGLISPMFTAKKLISPKEIGARLKGMGNLRDITDREIEYIKRIFELVNSSGVTEDEFCVVVALAERMTMMK